MAQPTVSVTLNDERVEFPGGSTVLDLVKHVTGDAQGTGVAVALDGAVVPRSAWESTPLHADARADVLTAVQGG